jgi:peptidoglycan hydrolase-like protein with peptidoglycan-binding domain
MKALRILVLSLASALLLGAAAFGAYAVYGTEFLPGRATDSEALGSSSGGPSPTADPSTGPPATPSASPGEAEPTEPPAPPFELAPGDRGLKVRELQHRLFQIAWLPELTTGSYDPATRAAVRGFQAKRGFEPTGVVDPRTWRRLRNMTSKPNHDQLHNIFHPGPTLYGPGAAGEEVRGVQARLVQIAWLSGDVTGSYDPATTAAVRGFQAKREIPVTGKVDQRTLDRLVAMTYAPTYDQRHNIVPEPGAPDPRCLTGRALCVDKSTNSLRWMVNGATVKTFDVRFGSAELPTREGAFSVFFKSRDHVSSLYHTSMPLAMFFSGGQAVHYSPDFAAHGYAGASHGCVNVRDYNGMLWLFDQVQVGDKVIVYWS